MNRDGAVAEREVEPDMTKSHNTAAAYGRYTELLNLAAGAELGVTFTNPELVADMAAESPSLMVALRNAFGEDLDAFLANPQIGAAGPDMDSLYAADPEWVAKLVWATHRGEIVGLALDRYRGNGNLCDGNDVDTAVVLHTLIQEDSTVADMLVAAHVSIEEITRVREVATSAEARLYARAAKNPGIIYDHNGTVDLERSEPEALCTLIDAAYIEDASRILTHNPTWRENLRAWMRRHPALNATVKGWPLVATTAVGGAAAFGPLATSTEATAAVLATTIGNAAIWVGRDLVESRRAALQTDSVVGAEKAAQEGSDAFQKRVLTSARLAAVVAKRREETQPPVR